MTTSNTVSPAPKRNNRMLIIGCIVALALVCVCIVLVGGVGGGAVAIQKLGLLSGTNTPTATSTPLPTPTFARTATPIPTSTRTATPAATSTPKGQVDWPIAFTDKLTSDAGNWGLHKQQPYSDDYGTYRESIGNGNLHVEVTAKKGLALKYFPDGPVLGDQYVSAQARQISGPKSAIYGLIFRVDAVNNYYYFFGVREDRNYAVFVHQSDWSTLVDWTQTDAIQVNQPNKLAALAQGSQLSFFVNDQKVGQIIDSRVAKGEAGVIMEVDNPGDQAVFEFSSFEVRAPAGSNIATVTPMPTRSPTASSQGGPGISDKFASNANGWNIASQQPSVTDYGTFRETIGNGKFRIEANATKGVSDKYWPTNMGPVSDFSLSVGAQRISGPITAGYGVIFRRDESGNFYAFEIRDDKTFAVFLYQGDWTTLRDWTQNSAIKPGAINTIGVTGQGSSLSFSINNQSVATIKDSALTSGRAGVTLDLNAGTVGTFEFSDFSVKTP